MTRDQQTQLVSLATSLIGKPYKYGAKAEEAPDVFDCSLFTQYIFKHIGIAIPRSTIEQAAEGEEISSLENLEIGDLIFLHGTRGHYNPRFPQGIGHVGVFIGDNKVIHAGSKRIQEKPKIIEKGEVKEQALQHVISLYEPIITIRRIT